MTDEIGGSLSEKLIGVVVVIISLGIILSTIIEIIDDTRIGNSVAFNDTMDDAETYSWLAATFMCLGILILTGKYILTTIEDL